MRTTVGQLLVNDALPPELRDYTRTLDKPGIQALFQQLAERYPDRYKEIASRLAHIGHEAAYATGGFSFGLQHLQRAQAAQAVDAQIRQELAAIRSDPNLSDDEKDQRTVAAIERHSQPLEAAIYKESLAEGNPLALQILSGTRGNKTNLRSVRGADLLYEDHHGRVIPVPVLSSYSEGLKPAEYFAGAFGARKGVIDVKMATANAGAFSKQLIQAAHRLIATKIDEDHPGPDAETRGLPVPTNDPDNEGALLARAAGGHPRNTVLTPRALKDLHARGIERILVRSPTVGGPPEGGVYARDAGVRERGGLPPLGDYVGIAAAHALGEKLSQGSLSSKHSGGVAGAGISTSGFSYINQLTQVPKHFPGGATHAQVDGPVGTIEEQPQGGWKVTVAGVPHYVPADRALRVAPGQQVEAGDVLSEGIPNPAELVKHKGVGEGRRAFTHMFREAFQNSNLTAHRRNVELLARGLIDHVRLTDEVGDYVAGDVVPYSSLEHTWEPRPGATVVSPRAAVGKYLEKPVLHHSVGTKVRPSMLQDFDDFGIKSVMVHSEPPPFEPVMLRGMATLSADPDFLTRHLGSNLTKSMLEAAHRSQSSDTAGTSFVPALALDPVHFGQQRLTKGWKPGRKAD